mmetsp:Transcript_104522/g.294532  ORF Transcript_104522/g.294532 Transcript_104522/m.294532 type:complete len:228 (-) Transcript_104522:758-1441(-)
MFNKYGLSPSTPASCPTSCTGSLMSSRSCFCTISNALVCSTACSHCAPAHLEKVCTRCSPASMARVSCAEVPFGTSVASCRRASCNTPISERNDSRSIAGSSGASSVSCGFVFTFFTLSANRSVLRLSSYSVWAGETFASMVVTELPLSASMSRCVSLLCLKGTCTPFFRGPAASFEMTCPSTDRLLLMHEPSRMRWPCAPVFFARSLPARSHILMPEFLIFPPAKT